MAAQAPDELLLARALDGLTDRSLRRANLRNLLERLSAEDVRGLAPQIARLDLRSDIVSRLPAELLVLVAEHCSFDDLGVFVQVSRGWRDMWTGDPVVASLSARWLPGAPRPGPGAERREHFAAALRTRYRRSRGFVRSVLEHRYRVGGEDYFTLDPALHPDPERAMDDMFGSQAACVREQPSPLRYMGGRIAWQPGALHPPHGSVIIVDDLRTRTRACYRADGLLLRGERLEICALGRELVVAKAKSSRTLYVWQLSSGRLETVTFPNEVLACTAEGLSLGVVTCRGPRKAFVWSFPGPLRELDFVGPSDAAIAAYFSSAEDASLLKPMPLSIQVLLPPSSPDTVFVSRGWRSGLESTPWPSVVGVDEFLRGEYVRSYHHATPVRDDGSPLPRWYHCSRVDNHGSWGLMWTCDDRLGAGRVPKVYEVSLLAFNMVSRQFRVEKYRVPFLRQETDPSSAFYGRFDVHFWCRQMTIQFHAGPGGGARLESMPAVTFNDITGPRYGESSRPPPPVPGPPGTGHTASTYFDHLDLVLKQLQLSDTWKKAMHLEFGRLDGGVPGYVRSPAAYCGLAFELPMSRDPARRFVDPSAHLNGDDDFLVRSDSCGRRYTVWAFDADMRGAETEDEAAARAEDAGQLVWVRPASPAWPASPE